MTKLTDKQALAIRCAFADLCGSLQAYNQSDIHVHDWRSHMLSIEELAEAFEGLGLDLVIPEDLV